MRTPDFDNGKSSPHRDKRSKPKMNGVAARCARLAAALLGLASLAMAQIGQAARAPQVGIPVPTDWSHHSLIFSKPATAEQDRRVAQDPRYWQQRYRSELPVMMPAAENRLASEFRSATSALRTQRNQKMKRDWGESLGAGASVGAGNYPAKFSFLGTTANCATATQPDFVVYSTGVSGSSTQASIVAYDNLYSGCSGSVPQTYWAYDTGGQILTSPAFSRDGTQLAFVETRGGFGILVLLKWAASTTESVGSPQTLTAVSVGAYPSCTAPCMTQVLLKDGSGIQTNDTTSSVFVDYSADTAWVGGDRGWLHKVTPLFKGVPVEVHSGGFPVQVNTGNTLASPVHDYSSGNVFVGDAGGFLYRVESATAGVTASGQLDFGTGIVGSPEVDSTAGLVYVFASSDGTANCTNGAACAAVYLLSSAFVSGDVGSEEPVGDSVIFGTLPNPNPLYNGDFDSSYKNSVNATGDLYVCGNTGGNPTIYQIAITAGVFGHINTGPILSPVGDNPACSPVTDILNPNVTGGATEWIFVSAQATGISSACAAGGCLFNFKDTPWQPSTEYIAGQEILDSNFHVEVVKTAGMSGSAAPIWNSSPGGSTTDGGVRWLDQGASTAVTPAARVNGHLYPVGAVIFDSNGNVQRVSTRGTSGASTPTWNTTVGGITTDGTAIWTNLGAIETAALPSAGGTSGIIIDNTVGSGTQPGASEVYFSTLSDQTTCGTFSDVGCAEQVSQSALK